MSRGRSVLVMAMQEDGPRTVTCLLQSCDVGDGNAGLKTQRAENVGWTEDPPEGVVRLDSDVGEHPREMEME